MKVLILSQECWRDDQNGGNVLSNIFDGFQAEFAQIYCSEEYPSNKLCKRYYQMTDSMMVDYHLKRRKRERIGRPLIFEEYPVDTNEKNIETSQGGVIKAVYKLKGLGLPVMQVAREIVWKLSPWYSEKLIEFVKDFDPDIIFAPCYGAHYMLKMTRLIYELTKKPIISYISDDFYTNRQLNFSPLFWINHFLLRKSIRKTVKLYSLMYTMTNEQKKQCEKDFDVPMKILRKSCKNNLEYESKELTIPIKLIYAGGLYLNRWVTLARLVKEIKKINENKFCYELNIYTNSRLSKKQDLLLNDRINSKVFQAVSGEILRDKYKESDIALHVEGFDIKHRLMVRLSFSTKIVDCIESGCAIMAICDKKQAGLAYLKRNNAAICIDSLNKIPLVLNEILENIEILEEFREKAYRLGIKKHNKEIITKELQDDFRKVDSRK